MLTPPGARELAPTWNLHRHKPELCPTRNREVVNLSGLAETKS